jgi:hypothetical protein
MDGRFQPYVRPDRGVAAWPTHDGLTVVIGGWPYAELEANRHDVEGNHHKMLELAPALASARVMAGLTSPAEFFAEANVHRILAHATPA